jgi:hypothetical protein
MKTGTALVALASAFVACLVSAADVTVLGAQREPMASATDVYIAAKDILNRPTALLNKNTVASDNNVMIARSNIVMTQNDRLALARKVEEALTMSTDASDPMATAVLTKNVLRAVSAPSDDSALMTKASAVVASKNDPGMLSRTIASFVDAAMANTKEQSLQSNAPNGMMLRVGTTDLLRQPTAAINKNFALNSNQIAIGRSHIMPTQNDQVVLRGAKVADVVAPASVLDVGAVSDMKGMMIKSDEDLEKKKKKKSGKKEAEDVEGDDEVHDEEFEKKKTKKKKYE